MAAQLRPRVNHPTPTARKRLEGRPDAPRPTAMRATDRGRLLQRLVGERGSETALRSPPKQDDPRRPQGLPNLKPWRGSELGGPGTAMRLCCVESRSPAPADHRGPIRATAPANLGPSKDQHRERDSGWSGQRLPAARIGEAGEREARCFRGCVSLPNGPALSCAPPVEHEDTPAGGRRSCPPTGRPPAGEPRRPRSGGASAAAPCWAAFPCGLGTHRPISRSIVH